MTPLYDPKRTPFDQAQQLIAAYGRQHDKYTEDCVASIAGFDDARLKELALALSCVDKPGTLGLVVSKELRKRMGFVMPPTYPVSHFYSP